MLNRCRLLLVAMLVSANAFAGTPVVIDRGFLVSQLKTLSAQLDTARQQLQQTPNETVDRQLWAVQNSLGELSRLVSEALPAGSTQTVTLAPPPGQIYPIDDAAFSGLLAAIKGESFRAGKMRVLSSAAAGNYFLVAQLVQLVQALTFSPDKVRAIELVAPRLVDPQNSFQIYDALPFEADKRRARQILGR